MRERLAKDPIRGCQGSSLLADSGLSNGCNDQTGLFLPEGRRCKVFVIDEKGSLLRRASNLRTQGWLPPRENPTPYIRI